MLTTNKNANNNLFISDINECKLYKSLCGEHAHCVNTLGSYRCSCDQHYIGDGIICLHSELNEFLNIAQCCSKNLKPFSLIPFEEKNCRIKEKPHVQDYFA
jgi:hypothetical protein